MALAAACSAIVVGGVHAGGYDTLRIVAPAHDATVHDNSGNVTVTVAISPRLRAEAGERLALLLDGKVVASGAEPRFVLADVERGAHTLQVRVTAADGADVQVSPPATFYMWRASRLFPGRKN